jgi:NADH-quinone oxidoreductase subunit L
MNLELLVMLIVLIPALTALTAGTVSYLLPRRLRDSFAMLLTSGGMVVCGVLSLFVFRAIALGDAAPFDVSFFTWLQAAEWKVDFGLLVDKLTVTMLLVVCSVSACVHVYAIGYMKDDPSRARFFAYLSFFTFTMLVLVTAPNLLQMFLGWEGVGLASYLLIGFWHHKESANAAAMKAFITNRVADAAMLLGIFTLLMTFGSLDYADILPRAGEVAAQNFTFLGTTWPVLDVICLLLFIGAMGKSAQFGLHVWLPDAMEGPTPVSALIHAATMVTAGVFLLSRLSPLYEMSDSVLTLVALVGALTAIFAATVGLTQKDIKRVIAYSTCSQLGYMFFAIGVSAYPAAMFHLTTHAFFKALLFLGAGSVIHALHHEQNMFKMGAVRVVLPMTYGLMWVGSLALAGIPPFAGYFSKDLVLESAFGAGSEVGYVIYLLGTLGALLTAFYSFRVLFMVFHGRYRGEEDTWTHAHESPPVMLIPMVLLAVGAVFSGMYLSDMGTIEWWQGALVIEENHPALENAHHSPWLVKFLPLMVALGGVGLAAFMYLRRTDWPARWARGLDLLYQISLNKWYVDELYDLSIIAPTRRLSQALWKVGDVLMIDGLGPNGVAALTAWAGQRLRRGQTGYVYHYAFVVVVGVSLLIMWVALS